MIYFNPISMSPIDDEEYCFKSLRETLIFLSKIDEKFILCLPSNGPDLSISGGISFNSLVRKVKDDDLKSLLVTILSNSTNYLGVLPNDFIEVSSNKPFPAFETYISYDSKYNIILSLHTNPHWSMKSISLRNNEEFYSYHNSPPKELSDFISAMDKWEDILRYVFSKKEAVEGYLALSNSISNIFPDWIWDLYSASLSSPGNKIPSIRRMAKFIAEINGYEFNLSVSNKNRSSEAIRDIYYCSQRRLYLSTDLKHGRFEVLDFSGKHICEVDFLGKKTKSQDKSGRHNIIA